MMPEQRITAPGPSHPSKEEIMPQVTVTIAGRLYRMACGEGEEEHLQELGQRLDGKIADLRAHFGEIGDQRITVMAALTMADELSEAERRISALQTELKGLREVRDKAGAEIEAMGDAVAEVIEEAAEVIDKVAGGLSGPRN
jgi:cell division protein ZapA